jgi:hypothetical protein
MRALLFTLAALVALLPGGCCSTQVSATGYQRQCVWSNRGGASPAPPVTATGSPPPEGVENLELVWLPEFGLYAVGVRPCTFYRLGRLYRHDGDRWETSTALAGPWSHLDEAELPEGLRRSKVPVCATAETPAADLDSDTMAMLSHLSRRGEGSRYTLETEDQVVKPPSPSYSYRRASMGSSFEALLAG